MLETSKAYGITDITTAEAGFDYEHVSFQYDNTADEGNGFIVPTIQDTEVEGFEAFRLIVFESEDLYIGSQVRRRREATHPFDPRATPFPCATIIIVDDDGESGR